MSRMSTWSRLVFVALSLAAGAACTVKGNELDTDGADDTAIDDWDTDTDADSEDDGAIPAYWSLDGTLVVTGGAVVLDGSSLRLGFVDGELAEVCAVDASILTAADALPPREVPLASWWALEIDLGEGCSWAWDRYGSLTLGFGELDPRLTPAIEAQGDLAEGADTLYGLYLQEAGGEDDEPPVFVFGVAGTPGQYDGSTPPEPGTAPADGTYALRGLHLLPYTQPG